MITLKSLTIRDLAIVSEAEVEFGPGLSVITGETGTGKSLLVGAINLLLGERARSDLVRSGKRRALIEGEFVGDLSRLKPILSREGIEVASDLLTLTREVSADGRSRCLVDDQRLTVGAMREIGELICDLHGQHQHQWLLNPDRHLWFLDRFAGCSESASQLAQRFTAYRELKAKLADTRREINSRRERRELHRFQLEEIDRASLSPAEEQELERERRELENIARIKERLYDSQRKLDDEGGATEMTVAVLRNLQAIAENLPAVESLLPELESARISLTEAGRMIAEHASRLVEDPARLEQIGARLSSIYDLKRKYGGTIESVLAYRSQIAISLQEADTLDQDAERLQQLLQQEADLLVAAATRLQQVRAKAALALSVKMKEKLKALGMAQARFLLEFSDPQGAELVQSDAKEFLVAQTGIKDCQILFSANPGEEPRALSRIASGGEISRVMLALKSLISGNDQVDLLVFDEIDVGIGGETALLVGRQLRQLAGAQQVVAITHLQQIAAYADHHYRASKRRVGGRTESKLELLTSSERVAELGRMISGGVLGEEERKQAEKLLAQAGGKTV